MGRPKKKKVTKSVANREPVIKTGRPLAEISAHQVEKLAKLGCTMEEIGFFFGVHKSTISRRFATEMEKGLNDIKIRLRRAQLRSAWGGNVVMQIFLGKNLLKQTDKSEIDHTVMSPKMKLIRTDGTVVEFSREGEKDDKRESETDIK